MDHTSFMHSHIHIHSFSTSGGGGGGRYIFFSDLTCVPVRIELSLNDDANFLLLFLFFGMYIILLLRGMMMMFSIKSVQYEAISCRKCWVMEREKA